MQADNKGKLLNKKLKSKYSGEVIVLNNNDDDDDKEVDAEKDKISREKHQINQTQVESKFSKIIKPNKNAITPNKTPNKNAIIPNKNTNRNDITPTPENSNKILTPTPENSNKNLTPTPDNSNKKNTPLDNNTQSVLTSQLNNFYIIPKFSLYQDQEKKIQNVELQSSNNYTSLSNGINEQLKQLNNKIMNLEVKLVQSEEINKELNNKLLEIKEKEIEQKNASVDINKNEVLIKLFVAAGKLMIKLDDTINQKMEKEECRSFKCNNYSCKRENKSETTETSSKLKDLAYTNKDSDARCFFCNKTRHKANNCESRIDTPK